MEKQALPGTNKCWFSAILSLLLALLATFYRDAPSFLYALGYLLVWFAQIFILFFLLIWKKEDAQSYQARCLLNLSFWISLIINSLGGILWTYCIFFVSFNYVMLITVLVTIPLIYVVTKKYINVLNCTNVI